jgi:hypothetical protein
MLGHASRRWRSVPALGYLPRMRLALVGLVLVTLVLPAGARSKRKQQCKRACGGMIAACAAGTGAAGFGNLARGCRKAVLKRCKKEGTAACGAFCGNGVVDAGEACDGAALGAATCTSLGFASGSLGCTPGCRLDTTGCAPFPAPLPLLCGNGVVNAPEQCDGTALGGATCGSLGFTLGGTLACGAGCAFDVSGCRSQRFPETGQTMPFPGSKADAAPVPVPDDGTVQAGKSLAYLDNQDGTITDLNTGLMWEQKDDAGGLHDKDRGYPWNRMMEDEETIWDWLDQINAGTGFAGHRDWRIPNVKELQSLVSYGRVAPAIEPVFHTNCIATCDVSMFTCGCTESDRYWSSSTSAGEPEKAWIVSFTDGAVGTLDKQAFSAVRAVRGGFLSDAALP